MSTTLDHAMGTAKDAIGTAKDAIDTAKGGAEHAASGARSTFLDLAKLAVSVYSSVRAFDGDNALGLIGLERRRSSLRELPVFGAGVLIGAGVALFLAPMSGKALRRKLLSGLDELQKEASDEVRDAERKLEKKAGDVADAVKSKVEAAEESVKEAFAESKSSGSSKNGQGEGAKTSKTHHGSAEGGRSVS